MNNINELSVILNKMKDEKEIRQFLLEVLTESELADLSKRWQIIKMLNDGSTQREIAKELNVSLCKVTRGAKILKEKNAVVKKYLKG
ncbi:MAG: trp operon repressor [Cyanobacteria bacterium RUI128]|nr:trp operon repressor [Cyanobacteria bacterium RUI128]